ncbi:reactive intermediate/imine deaminase [Flaviflexus salsibiostraticola]|uniref:Reactive intermediate/imine deaminase n=1 Tax=Flaviflexus salsibiostraticola TaxID=1282737 RepID=A0A3S8ZCD1_9ACTO|nr:RidA family protein [Flaviflexus salsibiostraticola]AZN31173.1 reactive intermediate/imine deaminase [Flaviflexus salsibiostraticola]
MTGYNEVLARNTESAPRNSSSSQTVAFSHYNNLSAQLPIDPATGELVEGGVREQAEQCLTNIRTVVESIGHTMEDVVRLGVFLTDPADLGTFNDVYTTVFTDYVPARTSVVVDALPMGAMIQVEAVLSNGEGTIPDAPQAGDLVKVTHDTANAPVSALSTQTVAFSHYNHLSAQLPNDPATGDLVVGGVTEQAAQCLRNVKAILEGIDVPLDDIVKVTVFLADLSDLEVFDKVYSTFFPDSAIARSVGYLPARTVVEARAPMGALVQVEAVVSHGDGTPPQEVEDRHGIVIWARNTDDAPKNPLSTQTVAFSHYNNLSALLPVDPATGELVDGGAAEQAERCLASMKAIVESIDHSLADVVKVNLFLTDLDDMDDVEAVYAAYFPNGTPARRTVGVTALPLGARVQMDAIVSNAEGTPPRI